MKVNSLFQDLVEKIRDARCALALSPLRTRILKVQGLDIKSYVVLCDMYRKKVEQLKKEGSYYEKISKRSEDPEEDDHTRLG